MHPAKGDPPIGLAAEIMEAPISTRANTDSLTAMKMLATVSATTGGRESRSIRSIISTTTKSYNLITKQRASSRTHESGSSGLRSFVITLPNSSRVTGQMAGRRFPGMNALHPLKVLPGSENRSETVSYTHLTLPTKA